MHYAKKTARNLGSADSTDPVVDEYRKLLSEYRNQLDFQRQQIVDLQNIIQSLLERQMTLYDMRGAQFAGGFAETVQGNQASEKNSVIAKIERDTS